MYVLVDGDNRIISYSSSFQEGFIEISDINLNFNSFDYVIDPNTKEVSTVQKTYTPSKDEILNRLKVTISNGKVFYADPISRVDISNAIDVANKKNLTETQWKLAEPIDGSQIVTVTLDELEEALEKALLRKAEIIGI